MYIRLARWCYQRRVFVVVFWTIAFFAIQILSAGIGTDFNEQFDSLGSESDRGNEILREDFAGQGASFLQGTIVVRSEDGADSPAVQAAFEQLLALARETEGITAVGPFDPESGGRQISATEPIAYAQIEGNEDLLTFNDTVEVGADLLERAEQIEADNPGLEIEIGGAAFAEFAVPSSETIGIAFAIVILILAFGSVLAMGLPLAVAFAGVGIGIALSNLASHVTTMPEFGPIIATMIGLGVGIDYALFVVTRYREGLHEGFAPETSTAAAGDTATRAVVFAGLTVVVSLLGLLLIGLGFVAGLGVAAAITVAVTILATVTLLPALLGFAKLRVELTRWRGLIAAGLAAVALLGVGFKVNSLALAAAALAVLVLIAGFFVPALKREVPKPTRKPAERSVWYRWSHGIQRRPWLFVVGGAAILLFLAYPLTDLHLGTSDEGNYATDTTTRKAYDLLTDGFGPGYNSPFIAVTALDGADDVAAFEQVRTAIENTNGVASVTPVNPNDPDAPSAANLLIFADFSPQSEEAEQLVEQLRSDVIPSAEQAAGNAVEVFLTGPVPANIDFADYMSGRQLVFFTVVLLASFILLMVVFRSILVPLKAVVMNLLSIASAYGVIVALFQWGHLSEITGLAAGPVEPWAPMMLFAMVFGLSMDYEVFLLSRIREEYEHTGDAKNSVANGLTSTARVITAAAAIMVVVFGSFVLEDDRVSKLMGVGLAVAVLLDATVVRMILVPATMELLGHKNWWIPKWLDRILPRLHVEGSPGHKAEIAAIQAEVDRAEPRDFPAGEPELEPV